MLQKHSSRPFCCVNLKKKGVRSLWLIDRFIFYVTFSFCFLPCNIYPRRWGWTWKAFFCFIWRVEVSRRLITRTKLLVRRVGEGRGGARADRAWTSLNVFVRNIMLSFRFFAHHYYLTCCTVSLAFLRPASCCGAIRVWCDWTWYVYFSSSVNFS